MTDTTAVLPTPAVTGSTGALGGRVARELAERGIGQRLLARSPTRAPVLPGATAVAFSYTDAALAEQALRGVDVLFMVSATEAPDRVEVHRTFVDAAARAGVRHVVYTSFFNAAPDSTFTFGRDHYATEQHIKGSEMDHTFLRDNFYLDFLTTLPGEDGVIRGPAGDGRVAAVARADVARVAAAVLADPQPHRGRTYDLTGPAALSMTDVAAILTEQSGRVVTYHDETIDEAYASRRRWPAEPWQYDAWVSTYTAIAAGELDGPTGDVAAVSGRVPTSLLDILLSS